ncbi:9164_t:CDS:10 [Entrophospora sp. SA101]|nr:9164_t:CDS:10 [Entrophospora sp. SA101]
MNNNDFYNNLWKLLDKQRGSMDLHKYKEICFDLIFLLAINRKFEQQKAELDPEDREDPDYYDLWLDEKSHKIENYNTDYKDLTHKGTFLSKNLDFQKLSTIFHDFDNAFIQKGGKLQLDYLGNAYQFFLQQFAASSGRTGGEFYTPACVVQLLVNILQPFPRKDYEIVIYDPCCGSGGMFVQSSRAEDTFKEDLHPNKNADYIITNPPFNIANDQIKEDDPQHCLSKLKEKGVAAIIMANGTLSGLNKKVASIRQKLVESNLVEAIITLPNNLFYTTGIAPCVWILRKNRENEKVLMVDISQDDFGEKISSSQRILTEKNIKEVTELYHQFLNQSELPQNGLIAKIISQAEIKENNYILVPARYLSSNEIELTPQQIDEKLLETTRMNRENKNSPIIDPNFFTVDAVELAQKLLGKILVRNINGQLIKVKIVETEAYIGKIDRACHTHLENSMYYCFNIASSLEGDPQGVLIRAAEPLDHHTIPVSSLHDERKKYHYYTNGPGKLCRALNIDISLNNVDLTTSDLIYLEDQPELSPDQIIATTREKSEEKKYPATIYPQNNKGYKEVLQKLFSPDSPNDRTFSLDYVLANLSNNCLIIFEAQKLEEEENYQKTLEKELKVIEKLNYTDYFLVFSDITNHLKEENIIVGPGRGSAVSSLVTYLLGINKVDPLEHKLFFERFLNEKRKNLPDIDLDVENQEEVFNYLQKKYPKKQVARIITKKKIGWKTALREVAKLYGIGEIKLKEITALTGDNPNFDNLKLQRWQNSYPNLFQLTGKIQNLYYDTSIHPAGIIISATSLIGMVPLKSEKDYLLALSEEDKLAKLGLKKYDFLSLRETLGFIREARTNPQISLPTYQEVNLADKKTWKLLENFLLTGIFQLDTPSARALFNRFCPQNFTELVLFLALNRPGNRKKVEEISQKKISKDKVTFTSPAIKEILAETYGHIIFEEQISQIFVHVYGCSFAEAEVKRRELAEKGLEKEFLDQAQKVMGLLESKLIYQQINSSLGYTFNKAHAVAYSYLTYYIAYLKANFFPELITYFLNKKKEKELTYLQEAFFYGFQIKGPDINYSEADSDSLLTRKEAIFRYLSIRRKLTTINNSLPFLDLPSEKLAANKMIINQREFESLVFQKIAEYDNQEISINVYAIICQQEKKDENNYTLLLHDIRNSFKLNITKEFCLENKADLVVHNELLFTLKIRVKQDYDKKSKGKND